MLKKCPYCAEEILEDAIKCKHCGEFTVNNSNPLHRKESMRLKHKIILWIIGLLIVVCVVYPAFEFDTTTYDEYKTRSGKVWSIDEDRSLWIDNNHVQTDATGRYLVVGVSNGKWTFKYDGAYSGETEKAYFIGKRNDTDMYIASETSFIRFIIALLIIGVIAAVTTI